MDIKSMTINVFEKKIMELIRITNTDTVRLPLWSNGDIVGANCLLKEYRKLARNAINKDANREMIVDDVNFDLGDK